MNILNWIYFIAASIAYIISFGGSITSIKDKDENDVILCNFINFITIGLAFYATIGLFNSTVVLIIFWSLLGASIFLSLYTIYAFVFEMVVENFGKILAIITLCLLITIIFLSFKLDISSLIVNGGVGNTYKSIIPLVEIILVVWVPIAILLFIYWGTRKNIKHNKKEDIWHYKDYETDDLIYDLYDLYIKYMTKSENNVSRGSFLKKIDMCMVGSNISSKMRYIIFSNIERLADRIGPIHTISEFRRIVLQDYRDSYDINSFSFENTYLLENITERIQTIMKKEFGRNNQNAYDYNSIKAMNETIQEVKAILVKQVGIDNKQSIIEDNNLSSSQQQFIKELFHCLMTPISQVDASLSIIKAKLPQADEVLERSTKAIKAGIELTKSVLFAYRQVAFYTYNNASDDTLTIKDGILSAELLYISHNKKNIFFEHNNIPESIVGFSNYFILATLLPLLENAICATEPEQKIAISYTNTKQNHIFMITNPVKNLININSFYKDGFSSKNEKGKPHKGTGLSIVRNLIAYIENSKLDFELKDDILTVILKIHYNGI